jgi:fatty acid desaturase
MNCSLKTMAKLAAGLGAILAVVYFAVPAAQAFVWASAPILLSLICPVMMLVMMFTMRGNTGVVGDRGTKPSAAEMPAEARDAAPAKP